MGAPKTPTHTTQTTKVELPKWVDKASQENYQFAKDITDKPYVEYGGDTVAGPSQTTLDAYDMFKNTLGTGQAQIDQANSFFSKGGVGMAGMDRASYMNPFVDNVETKALEALDKTRRQSLMGVGDSAHSSNAFGGDRHGVMEGVTNAEAAESAGLLSANLRKEAFDTSSNLMQADIDNMFSGGQGLLAGSAADQEKRGKDFAGLLGIGQQEQTQTQAELDDAYSRWREGQDEDINDLNVRLSALGMSPYGKTESVDKVTSGGGGGGADWASAGVGALSLLFGLFSDERDKTDIKKLGKDPATGIDLYAYRYKGDPKSYPKVVGPMAQDIEDKFPGMVREVGGHKMVGVLGQ